MSASKGVLTGQHLGARGWTGRNKARDMSPQEVWPRGLEHRPRCWEPRYVEQVVNFGFPGPSPGLRESQEAPESGAGSRTVP